MALSRRGFSRSEANIWPGFVDAMTALLLVLFFVLSIFMIVQFTLNETITGQRTELDDLTAQISGLASALGLQEARNRALNDQIGALDARLADAARNADSQSAVIASLSRERAALLDAQSVARAQIASFEEQVASLLAQRDDLDTRLLVAQSELANTQAALSETSATLDESRATLAALQEAQSVEISAREAAEIALAQARSEISVQEQEARLAAARAEALEQMIAGLRAESAARADTIASLQDQVATNAQALLLAEAARRDAAARVASLESMQGDVNSQVRELRGRLDDATANLIANAEAQRLLEERLSAAELARVAVLAELSDAMRERDGVAAELAQTEAARIAALDAQAQSEADAERLAELLSTKNNAIAAAELALAERAAALSEAEQAQLAEAAAAEALRARLANADSELTAMTLALEEQRRRAEEALLELAAARAAADDLAALRGDATAALRARDIALEEARAIISERNREAEAAAAELELLNQQTAALRSELNALQGLLDASAARDAQAQVRLETLGSELNAALAQVASEQSARARAEQARADAEAARADAEEQARILLEAEADQLRNYRSEFFGRVREILGDREDVVITGDRFVFPSEVLFAAGSADLGAEGRAEIAKVAALVREVSGEIPPEINWVLRVDGHTDARPLNPGARFRNNWELSQARALSVVLYLVQEEAIPADRLAATGFGEFQPIDLGDSPEALARNRRIELKFTER
ncbi:MAG: peptidoglycan -binding protein [Paracoccaceae bacterium]